MALPMVHLGAAEAAKEYLKISAPPSYYLGAIAPDGVHMLEGYTSDIKNQSHLGTRGNRNTEPVKKFLQRLPEFASLDYALGYAVHILTDIAWKDSFLAEFRQRYQADPSPAQDQNKAYYNDADQIDLELYRTWEKREKIWQALGVAKPCQLPGILPGRAAELWNVRTLKWYDEPRRFEIPICYMSLSEVTAFMAHAGKLSACFIKDALAEYDFASLLKEDI